jgi:hypothetical protein
MTRRGGASSWKADAQDDEDDSDERYDDSIGYSDDSDEEEDYQDFLAREFGEGAGGSRLTPVQYVTVIVLLIVFILPVMLYVLAALSQ